jgi:lysophospholipase L1-like esterase
MNPRAVFVVYLLAGAAFSAAHADPLERLPRVRAKLAAGEPVTVVALGDSITTYFGNNSRDRGDYKVPMDAAYYGVFAGYLRLARPEATIRVINKGIGGETADRGLKRVEQDVLSHNPDLVFVMYGANDGRFGTAEGKPGPNRGQFRTKLKQIVGKIRATGADVILVAPTMSLADLAWLLPYRETALSLRDELDCPVLDGTLALWPVDEEVHSLEDVHHYLSRHFPPNGDNIHPWFSGHFQMGRRLWEQLDKGPEANPLAFEIETPAPLRMQGKTRLALKITNRSEKAFKGSVQVFFPKDMPIAESAPVTEELPNLATGARRALPPIALELAQGETRVIDWHLELPTLQTVCDSPLLMSWLGQRSGIGIATFTESANHLDYREPRFFQTAITAAEVHYRLDGTAPVAKLECTLTNLTGNPLTGRFHLGDIPGREIALPADESVTVTSDFPLPAGTRNSTRIDIPARVADAGGAVIGLTSVLLDAAPCVNALDRPVSIDADTTEWDAAEWHAFDAGNAKAEFAARVNAGNLYLVMRAIDPVLSFEQLPRIWQNSDGFELYLDARDEAQLNTPGPTFQLGFFPPKDPAKPLIVEPGTGAPKTGLEAVTTAWKRTADGYVIEAAVPLAMFGANKWEEGHMIGFSLGCNDVATLGEPRIQHQWTGNLHNYNSPVAYGWLRHGPGPVAWRVRIQ